MHNSNTSTRTLRFYQSPAKFFRANWPSLLIVLPITSYYRSRSLLVKILSVLVAIPLLLIVFPTLSALCRLLFRIPLIEINEQGISYNPAPVWLIKLGMSIRWEEIAALYVNELTMPRQKRTRIIRFLAVLPNEQETFAQREQIQSLRRFPLWGIMAATKTPFMLFEQMISPTNPESLLSAIENMYQDKLQANGIEIREEQKTVFERK